jgi:hypothetical protein
MDTAEVLPIAPGIRFAPSTICPISSSKEAQPLDIIIEQYPIELLPSQSGKKVYLARNNDWLELLKPQVVDPLTYMSKFRSHWFYHIGKLEVDALQESSRSADVLLEISARPEVTLKLYSVIASYLTQLQFPEFSEKQRIFYLKPK